MMWSTTAYEPHMKCPGKRLRVTYNTQTEGWFLPDEDIHTDKRPEEGRRKHMTGSGLLNTWICSSLQLQQASSRSISLCLTLLKSWALYMPGDNPGRHGNLYIKGA